MKATTTPGSQTPRYMGIQALRFVAAAMVVVMHGSHYASERLQPGPILENGAAGVDVFFVISGFVMMISSRGLFDQSDGWRVFSIRRIARIVPLYWALLSVKVATLLLLPAALAKTDIGWSEILASYLFVPHYNAEGSIAPILLVGWTLNFEMFFYLLLAVSLYAGFNAYRFVLPTLVVLSVAALFRPASGPALFFYLDPIILEFGFGMLIARFIGAGGALSKPVSIALIAAGVVALLLPVSVAPGLLRPLVWGLPAAAIVLGFCCLDREFSQVTPRWLSGLGDASYALYLIHPIVGPFAPTVLARLGIHSTVVSIALTLSISLAAAVLIHRLFEKPVERWLAPRLRSHGLRNGAGRPQAAGGAQET